MEVAKFTVAEKKACQVRSNVKTMLIVFFDIQGIVLKEFVNCLFSVVALQSTAYSM